MPLSDTTGPRNSPMGESTGSRTTGGDAQAPSPAARAATQTAILIQSSRIGADNVVQPGGEAESLAVNAPSLSKDRSSPAAPGPEPIAVQAARGRRRSGIWRDGGSRHRRGRAPGKGP